jgi:hypothetical protein
MRFALTMALVVGILVAVTPAGPRAGDAERVQKVCVQLAREMNKRGGRPVSSIEAAGQHLQVQLRDRRGMLTAMDSINVVDARIYELFCK